MRRLEIASAALVGLYAVFLLLPLFPGEPFAALLLAAALAVVACHLRFEGARWQMAPVYFLSGLLIFMEGVRIMSGPGLIAAVGWVILLFDMGAVLLCTLLPVFRLPPPTGPYKVGTQTRHLVDERRSDPFSERSDGRRELIIQIWYPADPGSNGRYAPYREKSITTFRSWHFALVAAHAMENAEIKRETAQYPLLIYTPSWSGIRTESTGLVEEFASRGFVVVGIDHPYSSSRVAFPGGRVAHRKFVGDEDYSSDEALNAFVRTANGQIALRTADARFVLDKLEHLNRDDPEGLLTDILDLDRVGIFGSSLGGGTAAEACSLDHRFKAGADLGGMISSATAERGLLVPFFFMFEGTYDLPPYVGDVDLSTVVAPARREITFSRAQLADMKRLASNSGGCWMTLKGIKHMHFFDSPFFTPLRNGEVDPDSVLRTIRARTLAFFRETLLEVEEATLESCRPTNPLVMSYEKWDAPRPLHQ